MRTLTITDDPEQVVDDLNGLVDPSPSIGHKHDGTAGNGPKINGADINGTVGSATNATNASNVTTSINSHSISSIFETNGTTVKEATHASTASACTGNANTASNGVPVGTVLPYAGCYPVPPSGFLLCDGHAVSKSMYSTLHSVIGDTYGSSGDMFNLPDLRGRIPIGLDNMGVGSADRVTNANADILGGAAGAENVQLTVDQLANHNHSPLYAMRSNAEYGTTNGQYVITSPYNYYSPTASFIDSSTGYTGSDQPHNNMQPWIALNYIIKC